MEAILKDIRLYDRLDVIKHRVKLCVSEKFRSESNNLRRELYAEIELLRIDFQEQLLLISSQDESEIEASKVLEIESLLTKEANTLGLVSAPLGNSIAAIYRFVTIWTYFAFAFTIMMFLIPLRCLHPLLRKCGCRNEFLPFDLIQKIFSKSLLWCFGIELVVENDAHQVDHEQPMLGMFSHSSNLDAFIVKGYSDISFKFVGKKSLFMLPIIGWVTRWGFGAIPIDRRNRKNALRSLEHLATAVHQHKRSIAISPEGTRSWNGQLAEFKKGPFYLQQDVKIPISPLLILGAHELWPRKQFLSASGRAVLRVLPPFTVDTLKSRDQNRLALRRHFLKHSQIKPSVDFEKPCSAAFDAFCHVWRILVWIIMWQTTKYAASIVSSFSSSVYGAIFIMLEVIMYLTC